MLVPLPRNNSSGADPKLPSLVRCFASVRKSGLYTIQGLKLDHAHVFGHPLLGADGMPARELHYVRPPLIIVQACLALGQPRPAQPRSRYGTGSAWPHGEPTCRGRKPELMFQESFFPVDAQSSI